MQAKGIVVDGQQVGTIERTLKNSPSVELYGLQGLPLTYFCTVS